MSCVFLFSIFTHDNCDKNDSSHLLFETLWSLLSTAKLNSWENSTLKCCSSQWVTVTNVPREAERIAACTDQKARSRTGVGTVVSSWKLLIGWQRSSQLGVILQDDLQFLTQHDVAFSLQLARKERLIKTKAQESRFSPKHTDGLLKKNTRSETRTSGEKTVRFQVGQSRSSTEPLASAKINHLPGLWWPRLFISTDQLISAAPFIIRDPAWGIFSLLPHPPDCLCVCSSHTQALDQYQALLETVLHGDGPSHRLMGCYRHNK